MALRARSSVPMKRIDVVKRKDGTWVGETNGRKVVGGATKAEVVKAAAAKARSGREPTSVRIHKQDGKLQEERNYPRRADQHRRRRRSKDPLAVLDEIWARNASNPMSEEEAIRIAREELLASRAEARDAR